MTARRATGDNALEMIEVDGLRVAYERAADGPPLVLRHGYVGDGAAMWRRQIDELSDEFTVVAWDAPGAGRSSDPPATFGAAGYADCLARFLEQLGLENAHLAGLSFSGALALALYRRRSQAQAAVYGPPPEIPNTAKRSSPRAAGTWRT